MAGSTTTTPCRVERRDTGAWSRNDVGGHAPDISRPARGASRFSHARTGRAARLRRRRDARLGRHSRRHHRHVMGGTARSALAAGGDTGPAALRGLVRAVRRSSSAPDRCVASVCTAIHRIRPRSRARSPDRFRRVLARLQRDITDGRSGRPIITSRARRGVRSARRRCLPVAAGRRTRRIRPRSARAAQWPATTRKLHRSEIRIRPSPDNRLSDALPAVRRSPIARSALASGVSRQLQPGGVARSGGRSRLRSPTEC